MLFTLTIVCKLMVQQVYNIFKQTLVQCRTYYIKHMSIWHYYDGGHGATVNTVSAVCM